MDKEEGRQEVQFGAAAPVGSPLSLTHDTQEPFQNGRPCLIILLSLVHEGKHGKQVWSPQQLGMQTAPGRHSLWASIPRAKDPLVGLQGEG